MDQNSQPAATPGIVPDNASSAPAPVNPAPQAASALEPVPSSWPGAFGVYKHSRDAVKFNLGPILTLVVLNAVIQLPVQLVLKGSLGELIAILISCALTIATLSAYFASVRREKISLGKALKKSYY